MPPLGFSLMGLSINLLLGFMSPVFKKADLPLDNVKLVLVSYAPGGGFLFALKVSFFVLSVIGFFRPEPNGTRCLSYWPASGISYIDDRVKSLLFVLSGLNSTYLVLLFVNLKLGSYIPGGGFLFSGFHFSFPPNVIFFESLSKDLNWKYFPPDGLS